MLRAEAIFILSAKYGLVDLDAERHFRILPYATVLAFVDLGVFVVFLLKPIIGSLDAERIARLGQRRRFFAFGSE